MTEMRLQESIILNTLKIAFKVILFLIAVVLFFIIGLFIGYSLIGKGNFWEVLNRDTWQHIINFIQ